MTRSFYRLTRRFASNTVRAARTPMVRSAVEQLEDRNAPALLAMGGSQTFGALNNSGFLTSGDWNDDGNRDLVLTNYGDGTVAGAGKNITFLYGNGDGTFGSASTKPVGGTADSVSYLAIGFINDDPYEDIVTIQTNQNTQAGTVSVFKGSAVGSFTQVGTAVSSAGNRPWAVQIADMTGDGKQDVVVTNIGHTDTAVGRNIAVLKNDGTGILTTHSTLDAANEDGVPLGLAVAKIDGDATYDLAVTYASVTFINEGEATEDLGVLRIFPGNGDGSFGTSARYDTVGKFPGVVIAAEVDGLPGIDIVVANAGNPDQPNGYANFGAGASVDLFRNDGGGAFGPAVSMKTGLTSAFMVAVADMNLDGRQDIVACDFGKPPSTSNIFGSPGAAVVYLQDPTIVGKFAGEVNSPYSTGKVGAQSMVIDNFNNLSSPDVAIVHWIGNYVVSLLNTTTPAAGTTTALVAAPSPATYGTGVTLTATVTSGGGTPTGTVTFLNGASVLGTGTLDGSGVATFNTAATQLPAQTLSLSARFEGAAGFATSTSSAFSLTVNKAATTNTLVSSAPFVTQGAGVTFTSTVTGPGLPTGQVSFWKGADQIGSGNLTTIGGVQKAEFVASTVGWVAGDYLITAKYASQANWLASDSAAVTLTVTSATGSSTATTIISTGSPSLATQAVTFTVTVTATSGVPTGTVEFWEGSTLLGSGTLVTVGADQKATFATSTLGIGTHQVVAKYVGVAGTFNPSESSAFSQVVDPIGTTVTVTASSNPSYVTQPVTFTAVVGSAISAATGTVTFWNGGVQIGQGTITTVGGLQQATFSTTNLAVGNYSISAKFAAQGNFKGSDSAAIPQTVNVIPTLTYQLGSSGSPSFVTQGVTISVLVRAQPDDVLAVNGPVEFWEGTTLLGTAPLEVFDPFGPNKIARFTTSALALGSHTIVAKFPGQAGIFDPSASTPFTQVVDVIGTTITVVSSNPTSLVTQPVTLTATVGAQFGAAAGMVTFWDGGVQIGSAPLAAAGGKQQAEFTTTNLALGSHTITAKFAAQGNFTASNSAGVTQTVDLIGTKVAIASSALSTLATQPVTFTATVTALFGAAAGTVTFWDGGVMIGQGSLVSVGSQRQATFTTSGLTVGTHAVTAKFAAAGDFTGSDSAPVSQLVNPIGTTITVTSGGSPSFVTQPVTFTALVAAQLGAATGTVTFWDGGVQIGSATVTTVGGQQVATFTGPLSEGSHTITAKFAAQGGFGPSESAPVAQVVNKVGTATTVATSLNPANEGVAVTLTAAVAGLVPIGAVPTGTVTFFDGATAIGSAPVVGGAATLAVTLAPGTHAITATFGGDANFTTSSAASVNQVVNAVVPPPPGPTPALIGFREFAVGAGAGMPAIARFFNPDSSERFSLDLFPGLTGGVRVTSADFNGDGVADMVAGTGPGSASQVRVIDGVTRTELFRVDPFEAAFVGGVYVASGDLTGDGIPDIVITPDEGGGPRVRVFSGADFKQVADFFGIDDPNFRGGARAGIGDLNGDGVADLAVSAGFGGGPRIAAFDGTGLTPGAIPPKLFADFFAFEAALRNGAFVAAGDLDGDGRADLIAGGGPGGGPRVTAFSGERLGSNQAVPIANFFGGDVNNRGGVRVAARNLDGDNLTDVVIGAGTGAGSRVTAYAGKSIRSASPPPELFSFDAYPGFAGGVYVG
ncbi:MAG TPA: Ig-like domain repeat protein [Fimbriiglobus sp.]|nr:Ig-like domain repeat protein [Fimbriiglobus sp.]